MGQDSDPDVAYVGQDSDPDRVVDSVRIGILTHAPGANAKRKIGQRVRPMLLLRPRRPGLSIMDVVVLLLLILAGLGLGIPWLVQQHRSSQRAQCAHNLKTLGDGVQTFHDKSAIKDKRWLPPSRIADGYATWPVLIAPYLKSDHPLTNWDPTRRYVEQEPSVREAWLKEMFCPSRSRPSRLSVAGDVDAAGQHHPGAVGDYGCVSGDGDKAHPWKTKDANGAMILGEVLEMKDERILRWRSRTGLESLTRGTSYTLLLGEKHVPKDAWGQADQGDGSIFNGGRPAGSARVGGPGFPLATAQAAAFENNFGGNHQNVCLFLAADLSLKALTSSISQDVLGEMMRREP